MILCSGGGYTEADTALWMTTCMILCSGGGCKEPDTDDTEPLSLQLSYVSLPMSIPFVSSPLSPIMNKE
jgi:hypothetical protein